MWYTHFCLLFFFSHKKDKKEMTSNPKQKEMVLNTMKNFHVHWLNNKPICNFFSTHYSKILLKNHYTSNEPINFVFLKIKFFLFLGTNQKIFVWGSCTWRHTWTLPRVLILATFYVKLTFLKLSIMCLLVLYTICITIYLYAFNLHFSLSFLIYNFISIIWS